MTFICVGFFMCLSLQILQPKALTKFSNCCRYISYPNITRNISYTLPSNVSIRVFIHIHFYFYPLENEKCWMNRFSQCLHLLKVLLTFLLAHHLQPHLKTQLCCYFTEIVSYISRNYQLFIQKRIMRQFKYYSH